MWPQLFPPKPSSPCGFSLQLMYGSGAVSHICISWKQQQSRQVPPSSPYSWPAGDKGWAWGWQVGTGIGRENLPAAIAVPCRVWHPKSPHPGTLDLPLSRPFSLPKLGLLQNWSQGGSGTRWGTDQSP